MKKRILLALPLLFLMGCSSCLKRQECEKTNWFAHGQMLAKKGMRPAEDSFVQECKKVEAEVSDAQLHNGFRSGVESYCKPEAVFDNGKNGEKLILDFCDSSSHWLLTKKHSEGVVIFCQPTNGYPVGASGKVYTGVCPQNLEPSFKKEYNRGRKKYLEQDILSLEQTIQDQNNEVTQKTVQLSAASAQLSHLRRPYQVQKIVGNQTITQTEDPDSWRRSQLENETSRLNREIQALQKSINTHRETIRQHRLELGTLE